MNLRQWRKKHNLNQTQAAELLGVTHITISNWERGKHNCLKGEHYRTILSVTSGEVTPNDLLGFTPQLISSIKRKKKGTFLPENIKNKL